MKIEDAAKILSISGEVTPELVKQAYKKACIKFHPDKGGSIEMMQAVNQAYDCLKAFTGLISESEAVNYPEELNAAINVAVALSGVFVEICGAWVWVTGETKAHKEALKAAGFLWAKKKVAWYFRPSDWKSAARGNWSLDDIRLKHGSSEVKGGNQKFVQAF